MSGSLDQALAADLAERKANHLYRRRRVSHGPQGTEMMIDGRPLLSFCSNDYLGLANHPEVIAAFKRGTHGTVTSMRGQRALHLTRSRVRTNTPGCVTCLTDQSDAAPGRRASILTGGQHPSAR